MPRSVVLVDGADRVVPLLVLGKVAQDVALDLGAGGLKLGVETHVVDGSDAQDRQLVVRIESVLVLELEVIVGG